MEPWVSDADRHALSHTIQYMTTFVNADLVKPGDEPKSLKDLTGPRWKGIMSAFDPRQNSALSTVLPTLMNRKLIDEATVKGIGLNEVNFYPTSDEPARGVIQGKHALYLLGSTAHMGTFIVSAGRSLPVKALDSEEGVIAANRSIGAIKDGPHPNAAKLFINWVLSQEGQMVLVKAQGAVPVRKDVPDFTPAALRVSQNKLVVPTRGGEREYPTFSRWMAGQAVEQVGCQYERDSRQCALSERFPRVIAAKIDAFRHCDPDVHRGKQSHDVEANRSSKSGDCFVPPHSDASPPVGTRNDGRQHFHPTL